MNKWKVIAPLALTAAGAVAAGLATLAKKPGQAEAPAASAPAAAAPQKLVAGVYSFISGYQDAATVELTLRFDPEVSSFAVVAEEFFVYSSASHVALFEGEDFRAQIEYQPYYAGEDFDAHVKGLQEKYRGFGEVHYAHLSGVKYLDGDGVCLCFPIPGDRHSCVLMQLFKVKKDDDEPIEALPDRASVRALLDSAKLDVRR